MHKSDTQFKPGRSGNPRGRTPGSGKIAKLRAMLEPHAEDLVQQAVAMALSGDTAALRMCLERLVPAIKVKDDPVRISGLKGDASLVEQARAVIDAVSTGKVTPGDAATLMQSVAGQARIIEIEQLESRIANLEMSNTTGGSNNGNTTTSKTTVQTETPGNQADSGQHDGP